MEYKDFTNEKITGFEAGFSDPKNLIIMEKTRTMQDWTPAEHAIYKAMQEVEKMPADVILTDAVNFLSKAFEKIGEYENKKNPTVAGLD